MSGNPVDEYLRGLRNTSEYLGQQKIRTLAAQFRDTLLQFPAFKAEIDFMLSQGAGVDYGTLATQLELALDKATGLMFDVSKLPVAFRNTQAMRDFEEVLRTTLKVRSVDRYACEFVKLCQRLEQEIAELQKRMEGEERARVEAAETARQEAEAKEVAEKRACQEAEANAYQEFWNPQFLSREYVLIEGSASQGIGDLYFARYQVTNQQYRLFISYLNGQTPKLEGRFSRTRFNNVLNQIAEDGLWDQKTSALKAVIRFFRDFSSYTFREYMQSDSDLVQLFKSSYDDKDEYNGDYQPVINVRLYAAKAYCLWLSLVESQGSNHEIYRLPTVKEWEWAASGGTRTYPWGDEAPGHGLANYANHVGHTTPVGSYPNGATPEGLYDMAGNAWEWLEKWSGDDSYCSKLRGGSWYNEADNLRCSSRVSYNPWNLSHYFVGFRVIRSSPNS